METMATAAMEVSCLESKTTRALTSPMSSATTIKATIHSASMMAVNHTVAATDSSIAQPVFGSTSSRKDNEDDKKGRLFNANKSVHYFHHVDEDSCHGCINHSSL